MSWPIPIHLAASLEQALVWFVVAVVWLVFQGLASKAKQSPPPTTSRPTPRPEPPPERPISDEMREFFETLSGQKSDTPEETAAESLPRPLPAPPMPTPPAARNRRYLDAKPPAPLAPPPRRRPVERQAVAYEQTTTDTPPAMPALKDFSPVAPPTRTSQQPMHVAPLMKMKWPRSYFRNLAFTAARHTQASRLQHQLLGQAALRRAMISRIVLGRPLGD